MKNKKQVNDLLLEISKNLKNITNSKNVIAYYWKACLYAEKLLNYCFEDEKISLPVDIRKLAEKLDIHIEEMNIDDLSNKNVDRSNHKIAQLLVQNNIFTGEREVIICVDKHIPISSKRYATIYEIAQYILHKDEARIYENYCVVPMCPTKIDKLITDIFSIFLLIPMRNFLNELCEYIEYRNSEQKIPIGTEEWIRYLAERAGISEYYAAYGYQYLRGCAYWIYQAWTVDNDTIAEIKMNKNEKREIKKWMSEEQFGKMKKLIYEVES